jgi:hypothetical protein
MKSLSHFEQIDLESASKTQMEDMVRALLNRANKDAQEIQRKTVELQSKEDKIQALTYELSYLRRIRYGAKTEAFSQLQKDLFEESLDEDLAAAEAALEALSDREPVVLSANLSALALDVSHCLSICLVLSFGTNN